MKLIIKLSGKVLEDESLTRVLCQEVAELTQSGNQLILIHGGGKQLTNHCKQMGISVRQVQGRRVTDQATLEAAQMVFSSINRGLTAELNAAGVRAVGIAGFDGGLTKAKKRPPVVVKDPVSGVGEEVDFGFVGDIESVDRAIVETFWEGGFTPVIACLCAEGGQVLNVNADTLAAELAIAVEADRVISLSDVDGIYLDPREPASKIPVLDISTAQAYLESGVFLDGMIPKVQNALYVLEQGVPVFQVLSGLTVGALSNFREPGSGTVMTR